MKTNFKTVENKAAVAAALAKIDARQYDKLSFKDVNILKALAQTVIKKTDLKDLSVELTGVYYNADHIAQVLF
jgi:hypothetical protein